MTSTDPSPASKYREHRCLAEQTRMTYAAGVDHSSSREDNGGETRRESREKGWEGDGVYGYLLKGMETERAVDQARLPRFSENQAGGGMAGKSPVNYGVSLLQAQPVGSLGPALSESRLADGTPWAGDTWSKYLVTAPGLCSVCTATSRCPILTMPIFTYKTTRFNPPTSALTHHRAGAAMGTGRLRLVA